MTYPTKSIRNKLLTMMLLVSSISILVGYVLFVSWYVHNQHQRNIKLVKTITNVLSQDIAKLMFLDNIEEASDITSILHSYKKLEKLVVYDKKLSIVYIYTKNQKAFTPKKLTKNPQEYTKIESNKLSLVHKIYYQNIQLGYMYAQVKTKSIVEIIIDALPTLLSFWLLLILLSFVLSLYYSKSFTKPISKLVNFLSTIDLKEEKEQIIESESDTKEFKILFDKTNEFLRDNREANKKLKIASVAFEIDSAMVVTDEHHRVLQINNTYSTITGFSQKDVFGNLIPLFKNRVENKKVYESIEKKLHKNNYWSGDIKNQRKNGTFFIEHLSIYAVTNNDNKVTHYVFSFLDITKQKELETKLKYLQEYDSLTGLANKSLALKKIDENLSERGVFISLDIRRFNEINRLYGYEIGDMLLKEVTSRIQTVFPKATTISRVENNRFVIYNICSKTTKEEIIIEAKSDAEYLLTLLQKAFHINEHSISIAVSIGIVLTEKDESAKTLFHKGNHLLAEAKEQGQTILFFDKTVTGNTQSMTNLYPQLQNAIKNNELELYYQLQYDAKQKPYAAEALIRWNHPKEGLISPALFIPLAEKTGLISQIGRLILKLGCKQLAEWQKNPLTKDLLLSINLGAKHFQEDDLVEQVKSIVQLYDFPCQNLKIELTEYIMVEDIDKIAKKMQALKDIGIKISLDDFGTGFSSLQYLQFFPIDQIKIDQAFVVNMLKNKTNIAIIQSIITLAQALKMEVIAEGVETKKLYEKLLELGCQHYQGYYFAKPQNIATVNHILLDGNKSM